MLTVAHPWLAIPLLIAPFAAYYLLPGYAEPREAMRAPFVRRIVELTGVEPSTGAAMLRRTGVQRALTVFVWLGLSLAALRPVWVEEPVVRTVPTRDLLLAVDLSGSMDTEDFVDAEGATIDRLTAVKQVLGDFLVRRDGDRVGLIFFGSAPFVQAPFTADLEVCRQLLDEARPRMAGPRTMIGDAIGLALRTFESSDLDERLLIVLTDGNDTGSAVAPVDAARIARDQGVRIHTVAVGDPTAAGEEEIDVKGLREVAETAGGRCFVAQDRSELEGIYDELDRIETREIETLSHRPRRELYAWPLGATLLVILLYHAFVRALVARRLHAVDAVLAAPPGEGGDDAR